MASFPFPTYGAHLTVLPTLWILDLPLALEAIGPFLSPPPAPRPPTHPSFSPRLPTPRPSTHTQVPLFSNGPLTDGQRFLSPSFLPPVLLPSPPLFFFFSPRVLFPRSFSAVPTVFPSAAHDTEITRMHLVRDRPSPLGVTADDVWCRDAPVTPGLPGWKVAPRPLSPSPVALVRSFSPPPHPPPPSPPLPPLATPHVFRGGLLGACFSLVPLCSRCLVW